MIEDCPYNARGKHYFTNPVGSGTKAEFEPVSFGERAEDTTYKRVEYSLMACNCGTTLKEKVIVK